MIYHVLPGDSLVEEFKKSKIDCEIIVCRECLVVGDVDADILPEFWYQRARFILSEYGEDEIEYHDRVADELAKLLDLVENDEVNLWFEYELFCSVNMWFCLSLLAGTGAAVYRVNPPIPSAAQKWKGFGGVDADSLALCLFCRKQFGQDGIVFGGKLWDAYRRKNWPRLWELSRNEHECFRFLNEVADAAIAEDIAPRRILAEIKAEGKSDFETEIFPEFTSRAGVYGFGDLQVRRLLDHFT
jgi:hypothetical protein